MSLYIRPFMIATEPFLGIKESNIVDFYVILSPVGPYISGVATIWLEDTYFRAGPGGTGNSKCGGNYAASLLPKKLAAKQGCNDCLFLDAKKNKYIEEFSGMSFFCVDKNNILYTPKINDSILDSITRDSIIKIAKKMKYKVKETKII
jgi:branched-chain amino acid aminotransferase